MKLVVAGDLNPSGGCGVVLRSRADVLLSPAVLVEHGSVPPGAFYVEGMPGVLKGSAEHPHYVVSEGARDLVFCFRAADDSFELKRRVVVTTRWRRVLCVACLGFATLGLCLAGWMAWQGLGVLMPPDLDPFGSWFTAGLAASVGAAGLEAARVWQVVWHWQRCVVLLLASGLLVLAPRRWVVRVDNATRDEIALSGKPAIRVAPGSTALVPRSFAASTWQDRSWRRDHFLCIDVAGTCRRVEVEAPWWLALWPSAVSFGCDLDLFAEEYREAAGAAASCAPSTAFEARVPVPMGGGFSSQDSTASVLIAPLKERAVASALTLQAARWSDYYQMRVEGTRADLIFEVDGPHRLKSTTLALGRMAPGATVPVPALLPIDELRPGDKILLGRVRIGEIEVGHLTCVLDGVSPIVLGTVRGVRSIGRLALYRGETLFSLFEASRPELGDEVVSCWPPTLEPSDRLELSLGANWEPGAFQMRLPFDRAPRRTQFFSAGGALWGTLDCGSEPGGRRGVLSLPIYDEVISAIPCASHPDATASASLTGCDAPTRHDAPMWSEATGVPAFVRHFIGCGSQADSYRVRLLRGGDKLVVGMTGSKPTVRALPGRACKVDWLRGIDLPPAEASARLCKGSASAYLRNHPIPGCDEQTSVLCR